MSLFASFASAIPLFYAIKTGMKGRDLKGQRQALDQMRPLAAQQAALAKAQYDPNSPLFQNLYRQEREMGEQSLAESVAEVSRQNRKLSMMGRAPLLSAERGGESVFRNLMKGHGEVGEQARLNTISRLSGAQQSLGRAQDAYRPIYEGEGDLSKSGYENDLTKVGAYSTIADVLRHLFSLNQPETIRWNQ